MQYNVKLLRIRNMLDFHFVVLKLAGVWCPNDWCNSKKIAYRIYSIVIILLMYSLGLSQLTRIILVKQSFTDFNDTFFILLSTNFSCFKAACSLMNQKNIKRLLNMFVGEDFCTARDDYERDVQKKCDGTCRKIAICLLTMVEVTAVFVIVAPLFAGIQLRDLPYKVLLPYDLLHPLIYWLTFIHHTFGAVLFTSISITTDAVITGFMLQLCTQLELLEHRFELMPEIISQAYHKSLTKKEIRTMERVMFCQNIQHHVHIYKIARTISKTFNDIIICQFCISALEICVSVYQLSMRTNNLVVLLTHVLYLICMLGQFFVYCYFGNEVTLQSKIMSNAFFGIDWTSFSLELKKDLSFLILCSSKPIEISCGAFVRLTLESFGNIVKTSYSAFNVLQSST